MKTASKIFYCLTFILLILCIVFCFFSFDKYGDYYNGTYGKSRNAYVGGDAYNYIINGTYFTAFATYAVGCGIGSVLTLFFGLLSSFLSAYEEKQENKLEELFTQIAETKETISEIKRAVDGSVSKTEARPSEPKPPKFLTNQTEEMVDSFPSTYEVKRRRTERQTSNQSGGSSVWDRMR